MSDSESNNFSSILDKYSRFLTRPEDRKQLLGLGHRLFGTKQKADTPPRPSFNLLLNKENELSLPALKPTGATRTGASRSMQPRYEPVLPLPDQLAEEVMVMQDRNAVLRARYKAIEGQRDDMRDEYGDLMELSIQRKVQFRLEVQKLKNELAQALSNSHPVSSDHTSSRASSRMSATRTVMDELAELNNAVVLRINSIKMAWANEVAPFNRTVMCR
jgi:hypothetical protein